MRGLSTAALATIGGVLAVALAAGTTPAGAAAGETTENVTNEDFYFSNDDYHRRNSWYDSHSDLDNYQRLMWCYKQ